MNDSVSVPDPYPSQRADARRNRNRLIAAALDQFAKHGLDATVVGIAKAAGVGVGTLYRHFPTREQLVIAAYGAELDRVCDAAPTLLAAHGPADALRLWMDCFMEYLTSKFGIADAVRNAVAAGAPQPRSRERLHAAMALLFDAAAGAGVVRSDLDVDDVMMTLVGIAIAADAPELAAQRHRMINLVFDGLELSDIRPSATNPDDPALEKFQAEQGALPTGTRAAAFHYESGFVDRSGS